MGKEPFEPYIQTVRNSALSPRVKEFILECFKNAKIGTELNGPLFAANIQNVPREDRASVKTFLTCLFKN